MTTLPISATPDAPSAVPAGAPETLERQLAFERALVDISARFAAVTPEAVEGEIRRGLRALLDFLEVDRSTFFELTPEGHCVTLCSVAVAGIEPVPVGPLADVAPWYVQQILAGRTLAYPRLPEGLPPEAAAEAEYVRRVGMRANLTVPLRVGDKVRFGIAAGESAGYLSFGFVAWTGTLEQILQWTANRSGCQVQAGVSSPCNHRMLEQPSSSLASNRIAMLFSPNDFEPSFLSITSIKKGAAWCRSSVKNCMIEPCSSASTTTFRSDNSCMG